MANKIATPSIDNAISYIQTIGDPVTYRGKRWYLIRRENSFTTAALIALHDAELLERWSSKTPNLVRIIGRDSL